MGEAAGPAHNGEAPAAQRRARWGRFVFVWTRSWLIGAGVALLAAVAYLACRLVTGSIEGPGAVGALTGAMAFATAGLAILYRAARYRVADAAHLASGTLTLTASGRTEVLTPAQIERISEVRRNPFRAHELRLGMWRNCIRVDLVSSGDRGIDLIYVVWVDDGHAFLEDLRISGFPVS